MDNNKNLSEACLGVIDKLISDVRDMKYIFNQAISMAKNIENQLLKSKSQIKEHINEDK